MLSRKPAVFVNAYSTYHAISGSSTSLGTRSHQCLWGEQRSYATIASDHDDETPERSQPGGRNHGQREGHTWPEAPKGRSCPTPYQIFAMKHNAVYSKSSFYDLVKLYHPDLSGSGGNGSKNAQDLQMERYRLIVAAHTILSDPVKRSAYDRFGAGWDGKAESNGSRARSGAHQPGPFSQSWTDPADPIWRNATWEDWERFHARRAEDQGTGKRTPRPPVYMKNSYFLALIVFLSIMGSSANYGRAQDAGTYFVEQRDIIHDRAAKDLRKVRQDISSIRDKEERIQWFMRQREATMGEMHQTDIEALREERANRVLSDREVCRSDDVSGKGT